MATEKTINARMQMKTDTALNWSKAINFIPKKGEIIIYEADSDYGYERMKIGDGSTKVNDLPFVIGAKDWNQNDSTASDYIKNRPCYRTTGRISLLNNVEFNFEEINGLFISSWETPIDIAAGNECFITWDGVEYKCVSGYLNGEGIVFVGNASIAGAGEDTGEPFIIIDTVIATLDTSQSHVIKFDMLTYDYSKLGTEYVENGRFLKNIVYHDRPEITLDEANEYCSRRDILLNWEDVWYDDISIDIYNNDTTYMTLWNSIAHTKMRIPMNGDGVFLKKNYSDTEVSILSNPTGFVGTASLVLDKQKASIMPKSISTFSTSDVLFVVKKNGLKNGQDFEVLGDGSVNTSALTIPSSTPDSTKKFKITVDDAGTISATEVTT